VGLLSRFLLWGYKHLNINAVAILAASQKSGTIDAGYKIGRSFTP
jgi:hypothetical protein